MRVDRRELAAVFAGGFAGALARAGLVEALPHDAGQWPWATFAVNVVGAFALGLVASLHGDAYNVALSLAVGLLAVWLGRAVA